MKNPRLEPSAASTTKRKASATKYRRRAPNPYVFGIYIAVVTALIGAIVTWFFARSSEAPTRDPHTYSITAQGRTVAGESTNPFEEAQGYRARVEVCERHGVEGILVTVSCYLTVRPSRNLTISNSRNPTTATYQDGSVAAICCMGIDDASPEPLYHIELPRGSVFRRTFNRGEDVHVLLNIPDSDPDRILDAITFSPGEGAPPVTLPLQGNMNDRVFSAAFINGRRGDPRIEELLRAAVRLREELRARQDRNRGLTYPE